MPRKPQPSTVPCRACRLFHHPDGVALPGDTLSLRPDAAKRAVRLGDVRRLPQKPSTTFKTSTEETA